MAAVGTLITLAVLKFVGNVGQQYDFIRELTYWLSINGHTTDMLAGVIRSEDLIYFLAVILLFLAFTVFRITFSRSSAGKLRQALSYLGVFAAVLAAGYLTSRPAAVRVWDTTRTRLNSICENSQKVLAEIDGPLTITNYVNLLDNASVPYLPLSMKQNETIFDPYMRFKPDLKVKYVYYYDGTPVSWSNPRFQGKSVEELRDYMAMIYNPQPAALQEPRGDPSDRGSERRGVPLRSHRPHGRRPRSLHPRLQRHAAPTRRGRDHRRTEEDDLHTASRRLRPGPRGALDDPSRRPRLHGLHDRQIFAFGTGQPGIRRLRSRPLDA